MSSSETVSSASRLLLVEDDALLRELVAHHLRVAGFDVVVADRAAAGWSSIDDVDAVILDWMLPDESGISLLRRLRGERGFELPVLMLTARAREAERVEGLEAGADDYLVKPFGTAELIARVRSLLRRRAPGRRLVAGDLSIDLERGSAALSGVALALTRREFDLLSFLMAHRSKAFGRNELLDAVWGEEFVGGTRTVDQHVSQLRAALGEGVVETVRGKGYRFGSVAAASRADQASG